MRSHEKTALAKRAANYLTREFGHANAAVHFYLVAFAAREVDRERRRATEARGKGTEQT